MDITISSKLVIPENELQWRFSRSSGPGGQNINKTNSRVEIIFDIQKSQSLSSYQKLRIKNQLKSKLINGCICIAAQNRRTQFENRKLALSRLSYILRDLLKQLPKERRETKPTRASSRRRVNSKRKRGEVKKNRNLGCIDDL